MSNLQKWENIIKEKKKKTPWRTFLKETCSWRPLTFYKNNRLISRWPDIGRVTAGSNDDYNKNYDTFTDFGIDYDFKIGFFENFRKVFSNTRLPSTLNFVGTENTEYADQVYTSKNVYLSNVIVIDCENILYSFNVKGNCRNVLNSSNILNNCENIYTSFGIINSYNVFYSHFINNSSNIWFSSNLTGCKECILCSDLLNESYCIANKKYDKDEYLEKKKEFSGLSSQFGDFYKRVDNIGKNHNAKDSFGNYIIDSENIENGYIVSFTKNGRNLVAVNAIGMTENMYDVCAAGGLPTSDFYGVVGGGGGSGVYNSCHMPNDSNIYYSYFLENCSFCIGCIGLKNKSFCILNKQYTKEEWYEMADKIFSQMEKEGTLGEFFPGSLNPFYFNDTMAYLIDDSFTKEEVEKEGYMWRDEEIKVDIPENCDIVETKDLLSLQGYDETGNWQINPEIMKKVIKDSSGNYYRIVKMEYDFLVKHGLPLPEIHWLDRIKLGFKFK